MNSNQPTAAALDAMFEADLVELPAEILRDIQTEVDADLERAQARRKTLDAILHRKYSASAWAERGRANKDSGLVRIKDGECVVVADGKKEVKWSQDGLRDIANTIRAGNDDPALYITSKVTLAVHESTYNSWPTRVQEFFQPARTVTVKDKFSIQLPGSK